MASKLDIEESTTSYSGHFPEDLPARSRPPPAASSWTQRMRSFFTFSLSSYSLVHTPDQAARVRHIVMIAILLLRSAMSALSILSAVIKKNIAGIVLYSLLAVLGLWFTATCLAIIGDAAGDRRVTGLVVVGRIYPFHCVKPGDICVKDSLFFKPILTIFSFRSAGTSMPSSAPAYSSMQDSSWPSSLV